MTDDVTFGHHMTMNFILICSLMSQLHFALLGGLIRLLWTEKIRSPILDQLKKTAVNEEAETPHKTAEWLNIRGWLTTHFHIKVPSLMMKKNASRLRKELLEKIREKNESPFSDFSRLARFITGRSVGIVFGGGGARGITQIAFIEQLIAKGIPIDMVGGTSIGSLVGALYAKYRDVDTMNVHMKDFCKRMSSLFTKILDITYPITAMFSGRGFNREIQQTVMETQIEDLWIPYFAISTDLTVSRMRVHTCGSLWRYVRGSMTLTGYLPPICDPRDGHYLVDGGYINNLPVDVAKTRGANIVLAIDVGAREDANLHNYGDYISGWYLLWQKWWPWAKTLRIPDLNEIQSRLAYIANNHLLEEFINSDACVYMRIENIDKFATMDFDKFDPIYDFGRENTSKILTEEIVENVKSTFSDQSRTLVKKKMKKSPTFVDLAAIFEKLPTPLKTSVSRAFLSEHSENEDEERLNPGYVSG